MAKSTSTYILAAWIVIPAITLIVLTCISSVIENWWELILPVFLVYLVSFIVNINVRKVCGKKIAGLRKSFVFVIIKTCLFTFSIVATIYSINTGGSKPVLVAFPTITLDIVYLIILIVIWVIMSVLNEITVK